MGKVLALVPKATPSSSPRLKSSPPARTFDPELVALVHRVGERIAGEHMTTLEAALDPKLGRRSSNAQLARDHLLAVVRWSTRLSYPDIAAILGCNHTTAILGLVRYFKTLNGGATPKPGEE